MVSIHTTGPLRGESVSRNMATLDFAKRVYLEYNARLGAEHVYTHRWTFEVVKCLEKDHRSVEATDFQNARRELAQ